MCIDITGRVSVEILIVMTLWGGNGLEGTDQSLKRDLFHCVPFTISSPPHPVLVPALSIYCFSTIKMVKQTTKESTTL